MKLDPYLTLYTNINSTWIKDLSLRPIPIKLLKENIGEKLHDTGLGSGFLDMTPKHRHKSKNRQMELHQSLKFLCIKEHSHRVKRHSTDCEEIFANHII